MSSNQIHEVDPRSYRRHFNQWRYPVSLNCHLCISEVIDRFTKVEKERRLRSRERKRREETGNSEINKIKDAVACH